MTPQYTLKLAKTLWENTYRGIVLDVSGNYLASLVIVPQIPLDRSVVPTDAPRAIPYALVLVEDAKITADNFVDFEANTAPILLAKLTTSDFNPEHCRFMYPSPAFMLQK